MTPPLLVVTPAEAGQKLTQFLGRVLAEDVPRSALMRWIRTGQVRVDGRRAGPFDRLESGQAVRLPPFAVLRDRSRTVAPCASLGAAKDIGLVAPATAQGGGEEAAAGLNVPAGAAGVKSAAPSGARGAPDGGPARPGGTFPAGASWGEAADERDTRAALAACGLGVAAINRDYLVLDKPAGLPVHPGSGWTDSVQTRLAACWPGAGFTPTIAHRLDRDTTGLLLVARTYRALAAAHQALKAGDAVKEYLAWTRGRFSLCAVGQMVELRDLLAKTGPHGGEKVAAGAGKPAWLDAWPLAVEDDRSLVRLRLHTGRTHQIRAQLAERGHPLVGDAKYGGGRGAMLLHAWRLTLAGEVFVCAPPWSGQWAVDAGLLQGF